VILWRPRSLWLPCRPEGQLVRPRRGFPTYPRARSVQRDRSRQRHPLPPLHRRGRLDRWDRWDQQGRSHRKQLVSLQKLKNLYLEEASLSAGAFDFAAALPILVRLGLQDVPISERELEQLRASLPGVRVG
jgi:hypothetical protein